MTADSALQACAILGWFGLLIGFSGRSGSRFSSANRDWTSLIGLMIQGLGLAFAWGWRRPWGSAFFPDRPMLDWVLVPIAILLVAFADWLVYRAIRELGKQWSLEARVLKDHELVTTGPYAIVRNPIYTGIYALMIATGFAFSTWPATLAAIPIYWIGTKLRISSEEQMLRGRFGTTFDAYAARVPAIIPNVRPNVPRHRAGSLCIAAAACLFSATDLRGFPRILDAPTPGGLRPPARAGIIRHESLSNPARTHV